MAKKTPPVTGKRECLREFILGEIRLGRLKPGDKLYSRAAFMGKFGCARATADQVITELVGSHVLESKKGEGTYVALPRRRTASGHLAVVTPELGDASMPQEMIHGLLEGFGSGVSLKYFTYSELRHPMSWESCKSQRGIAFIMPDVQHSTFLIEARSFGLPHVVVYRDPPESSFVCVDNRGGVRALIGRLTKAGHRRIGYLGYRQSRYHFPEQRYSGYLEGLLEYKLPYHSEWVRLISKNQEAEAIKSMFADAKVPTALVVENLALGSILSLLEKCGKIPGNGFDIAYIDAVPEGRYPFHVYSLQSTTRETGREAAKLLLKQLADPARLVQKYIVPTAV